LYASCINSIKILRSGSAVSRPRRCSPRAHPAFFAAPTEPLFLPTLSLYAEALSPAFFLQLVNFGLLFKHLVLDITGLKSGQRRRFPTFDLL